MVFRKGCLAPCMRHPGSKCPLMWKSPSGECSRRPVTMSIAGPVCLPWCKFGNEEGLAHHSLEPLLIWKSSMEVMGYDFVLFENSPKHPKHLWSKHMEKHSHVVSLVVCPSMRGWPVLRKRLLSMAIRRESMVWLGPATDKEVMKHFLSLLHRRTLVDSDVFAELDSTANIQAERTERGKRAGLELDACVDSHFEAYYKTSKQKMRAKLYQELLATKGGFTSGTLSVDMSQNPLARERASPFLVTQTRSSDMVLLRRGDRYGNFYTPNEIGFSQGWPSLELPCMLEVSSRHVLPPSTH